MSVVVTFEGFRPPPRYDALKWTQVRIDESASASGPWVTIETQALADYPDPTDPPLFNFTTEDATLTEGWYRIAFLDATGDEAIADPVFHGAVPDVPYMPSVQDVALLLRTRTVKGTNTGLGADSGSGDFTTFDSTTRPTSAEVASIINTSYGAMAGKLRVPLIESQHDTFRHIVALYAGVIIEVSFFKESVNEDLIRLWRDEIDALLESIAVKTEREQPATDTTSYGFGTLVVGGIRENVVPEADLMEGIDF